MYSNKMYVSLLSFFFIIQCFSPLISSQSLRQDYYETTCPFLGDLVWQGVVTATQADPRMAASLLRLHFHDCFVNGCDGSVLLDDSSGEQYARPNRNSLRGFEVIDSIKANVETLCQPKTVSCADILTLVARAAVKLASLPQNNQLWYQYYWYQPWPVVLGRQDGLVPNKTGAESDLPSPLESVDTLISKFAAKGLNTKDMVVLSGAHTIGLAQCFTFKSTRLYVSKPTMNFNLLHDLRNTCPNVNSSDNKLVPLDWKTKTVFDNIYYKNLLDNAGVLKTDQDLKSDDRTSWLVQNYARDQKLFMKDFGDSMVKMGNIGLITNGNPNGEIRRSCGSRN